MEIALLTDIHISADRLPVRGVDVTENFRSVLSSVTAAGDVDHIVVAGDICYLEGVISTMEWVKIQLDATGIPYSVIPGNHDNSVIMAQVFGMEHHLHAGELYYNEFLHSVHLVFMDTGRGSLSVDQLAWLSAIDSVVEHPSLIFMHHPPVEGVPYMDANFALQDRDECCRVLSGLERAQAIFCGHYHVDKLIEKPGLPPVYITPSTFFQIDDTQQDFAISTYDIAWRRISLHRDGDSIRMQTRVEWLPGHAGKS